MSLRLRAPAGLAFQTFGSQPTGSLRKKDLSSSPHSSSSSSSSSSPVSPVLTSTPAHPSRPKVTFVGPDRKGSRTDVFPLEGNLGGHTSSDGTATPVLGGWAKLRQHFVPPPQSENTEEASTSRLRGLVETMRKKTLGKRPKLPHLDSENPPVGKSPSVKDLISRFSTAQQGPEKVSEHAHAGYAAKIARFIGVAQSLNQDYGHISHPEGVLFAQYRNAYLQCDQSHRAHQATSVFLTTLTLPSSLGEGLQEARDRFAFLLAEGPGKKIFDSWKSELKVAADVYKSKVNSLVGDSPEINFLKAEVRYLIGEEGAPAVQGYMGYFIAHHQLHDELSKISPRAVLSPYLATAFEGHFEDLSQVPEAREALFTHKFLPFKEYMDDLEHEIESFLDHGVTLTSFARFKDEFGDFKQALQSSHITLNELNGKFLNLKECAQALCEDHYFVNTRIQRDLSEFGEQLEQSFSESVDTGTMAAFFDYALKLMFPITASPVLSVSGDFKGLEEALRGAQSSQEKFNVLYAYIETQYEDQGSPFAKLLAKEDQFMLTQHHKDRILATLIKRDSHMYQVFWSVEPPTGSVDSSQLPPPPPPAEDLPPSPPTTSGDHPVVPPHRKNPKAATWSGVMRSKGAIDKVISDLDGSDHTPDSQCRQTPHHDWSNKPIKRRGPIPSFSPPPAVVNRPEDNDDPPPPPHEDFPPPPPPPAPPQAPSVTRSTSPTTYTKGSLVLFLHAYSRLFAAVGLSARSSSEARLPSGVVSMMRDNVSYLISPNPTATKGPDDLLKRIEEGAKDRAPSATQGKTYTVVNFDEKRSKEIAAEIAAQEVQTKSLEEDPKRLEEKAIKDLQETIEEEGLGVPTYPQPPSAPASRSASPAPQPSVVFPPLSAKHEEELNRILGDLDDSLGSPLSERPSLQPPFPPKSPSLQSTDDSGFVEPSISSDPEIPLPPAGLFLPIDSPPALSVSFPPSDPLERYRNVASLRLQFANLAEQQKKDDLSRYYRPSPPPEIPFYRYANIECPNETRVVSGSGMDYPANHIGTTHIACEAPRRENIANFWNMVWEQGSSVIVMVAKEFEAGREKSAKYWDFGGENPHLTTFGNGLTVKLQSDIGSDGIVTRSFVLSKGKESRDVTQFQYTKWPDHGIPGENDPAKAALEIINLNNKVRQHTSKLPGAPGPVIVHCSAGVGRTGTYLAVDAMQEHQKADPSFNNFSLEDTVTSLRNARGVSTVQTLPQYYLLAEAAIQLSEKGPFAKA